MTAEPISIQRETEQQRGKRAWECIQEVVKKSDEVKKKYRTLARQLTALVRTNGLAQTLAFVYAKSKKERGAEQEAAALLFHHITASLPFDTNTVLPILLNADSTTHRRATTEVLAFARWLSRFAEAELPSEEDNKR